MGIRDWFSRERRPGPKVVGQSKGGSRMLSYGGSEFAGHQVGFTEESTLPLVEEREKVYAAIFGPADFVYHEMMPFVPHVDVYRIPPTDRRPFFTFVTGGMSDLAMSSPAELGAEFRRVELVFYAAEPKPEYQELLRRLAHFPHDNSTWIHWGHTMPNGNPPEAVFASGSLDCFFFMPSIVKPDSELGSRLHLEGEAVHLVWCVPISTAECNLKLERGADALYELFDKRSHPFIYDGDRPSYA